MTTLPIYDPPPSNFEIAMKLAAAGLRVFACDNTKRPEPGVGSWPNTATSDPEVITRMWARNPDFLIGLHLGAAGFLVVDADGRAGLWAFRALCAARGISLKGVPVVYTPSGGAHFYFRQRPGDRLNNSRGALPNRRFFWCDVRGYGGYTIAPGSIKWDGCLADAYAIEGHDPLAILNAPLLPDDLRAILLGEAFDGDAGGSAASAIKAPPEGVDDRGRERRRHYAQAMLDAWVAKVRGAGEGARNQTLNDAAYALGRCVGAGFLGDGEVRAALMKAAEACGYVKSDGQAAALKTIASGLSAGKAKPETFDDLASKVAAEETDIARLRELFAGADGERAMAADGTVYDAKTGEVIADAPTFAGWSFAGVEPAPPPPMLIKRLLPAEGIAFIGGQSGAGKTFVAVDMAVALASGTPFFEHPVRERVGVVIVAGEGAGTIGRRVEVARMAREIGDALPIAWRDFGGDLKKNVDAKALIVELRAIDAQFRATHGRRLGVVIIDTLAACFGLEDENSNAEASKAIAVMKLMASALGVVVAPVHHYGKGPETGLRGASAWRAGADVVLSVLAQRDESTGQVHNRRLCLAKSRNDTEGGEMRFDLKFETLGVDEDGARFGSCHIVPTPHGGHGSGEILSAATEKPLPQDARLYLKALGVALAEHGKDAWPFGAEGPKVRAVDRERVRGEFYSSRPADGDDADKKVEARRKAFGRGENVARGRGRIEMRVFGDTELVWSLT